MGEMIKIKLNTNTSVIAYAIIQHFMRNHANYIFLKDAARNYNLALFAKFSELVFTVL